MHRWKLARSRKGHTVNDAMIECLRIVKISAREAKRRGFVPAPYGNEEEFECMCGAILIACQSGRHRATIYAIEVANFLINFGISVTIDYRALYRGVPENDLRADFRGPCGCHLGPHMCQYVVESKAHFRELFKNVSAECEREADIAWDTIVCNAYKSMEWPDGWNTEDGRCFYDQGLNNRRLLHWHVSEQTPSRQDRIMVATWPSSPAATSWPLPRHASPRRPGSPEE